MPPKACSSFYIGKVNRKVVTDTQSSWQSSPAPATINGPIKMAVGTPGMSRPGWMWGHRILRHGSLSLPLDSSLLFHSTASTKLTWNRIPHYHRDRIKKNKRHKTFFYNLLDAIKRTHILEKKKPQNYRTWFFSLLYKLKKACGPNSLFYKYLSVIFLYTNEYSCVQNQENSRMISQTPSNKSGRTRGAQTGYRHITGSPSGLHDGNRLTSTQSHPYSTSTSHQVLLPFSCLRECTQHT